MRASAAAAGGAAVRAAVAGAVADHDLPARVAGRRIGLVQVRWLLVGPVGVRDRSCLDGRGGRLTRLQRELLLRRGEELERQPPEDVVGDRLGDGDVRVAGEAAGLV